MSSDNYFESAKSWSLIDTKPVLLYVENCDDCIVFWNKFVLSHKMALSLAMTRFNISPTPEMKEAMHQDHARLYYANAFRVTKKWDTMIKEKRIYSYLNKQMAKHISEAVREQTLGEVLGWFSYDRAINFPKGNANDR